MKRWLKLIYERIVSYKYNDGSIYALQRDKLLHFAQESGEYAIIDDDSIDRNIERFTINEARLAVEIFNSANEIFGHFTLRLMLMNMITYYGVEGNFKLSINSRGALRENVAKGSLIEGRFSQTMIDYLYHTGLISGLSTQNTPLVSSLGKTRKDIDKKFFGLSFLNSRIFLKLEGTNEIITKGYNTLEFPVGPLIALDGGGHFSNWREVGVHFSDLSSKRYSTYKTYIDNFVDFQEDRVITYILDNKIRPMIASYRLGHHITSIETLPFFEEIIHELRSELLDLATLRPLRKKLETFAGSGESNIRITFKTIDPKTGKRVTVLFSKEDLVEMGFVEWSTYGGSKHTSSLEINDYLSNKKELTRNKVYNYLDFIINSVGSGKVALIPLVYSGDPKTGYQVLERTEFGDDLEYSYLPDSGYFKFDTNNDKSLFYKEQLMHCIRLMQSGRVAFVMKKWEGDFDNLGDYLTDQENFIMAFTRNKVLDPKDFISQNSMISVEGYNSYHIEVGEYSTPYKPTQRDWQENWLSAIPLSDAELETILDFITSDELRELFK